MATAFILAEAIAPGNVVQLCVARCLIRGAVRYGQEAGIRGKFLGCGPVHLKEESGGPIKVALTGESGELYPA